MSSCTPKSTPADTNSMLTREMSPKTHQQHEEMKKIPYRQAIGALIYAAVTTRPDIAYAVGQAAQFSENPGWPHWEGVKRILAYIKGTTDYGITFSSNHLRLRALCNSDYARCPDTRKSVTG